MKITYRLEHLKLIVLPVIKDFMNEYLFILIFQKYKTRFKNVSGKTRVFFISILFISLIESAVKKHEN